MKMLAPVPGQSFNLANGSQYTAGDDRAIEVETQDVAEMRRVGSTPVLPATTAVTTPTWGTVTAAEAGEAAAEEPTEQ